MLSVLHASAAALLLFLPSSLAQNSTTNGTSSCENNDQVYSIPVNASRGVNIAAHNCAPNAAPWTVTQTLSTPLVPGDGSGHVRWNWFMSVPANEPVTCGTSRRMCIYRPPPTNTSGGAGCEDVYSDRCRTAIESWNALPDDPGRRVSACPNLRGNEAIREACPDMNGATYGMFIYTESDRACNFTNQAPNGIQINGSGQYDTQNIVTQAVDSSITWGSDAAYDYGARATSPLVLMSWYQNEQNETVHQRTSLICARPDGFTPGSRVVSMSRAMGLTSKGIAGMMVWCALGAVVGSLML